MWVVDCVKFIIFYVLSCFDYYIGFFYVFIFRMYVVKFYKGGFKLFEVGEYFIVFIFESSFWFVVCECSMCMVMFGSLFFS